MAVKVVKLSDLIGQGLSVGTIAVSLVDNEELRTALFSGYILPDEGIKLFLGFLGVVPVFGQVPIIAFVLVQGVIDQGLFSG